MSCSCPFSCSLRVKRVSLSRIQFDARQVLRVAASSLDGDISSHTAPLVRSCGARDDPAVTSTTITLAFKLAYTAFVLLVIAVWWKNYGWKNFLWFSDIALIGAVPALWLESAALASVLTVAVLLPELFWNVDFAARLLLRRRFTGLTEYMFEPAQPRILRGLSLFHVPLPAVLLWMVAAYGYQPRVGLTGAIVLAAVVLPLSRQLGDPDTNINWTYGLGRPNRRLSGAAYVGLLYLGLVVFVFLPTDLLLRTAGF